MIDAIFIVLGGWLLFCVALGLAVLDGPRK